MIFLEKSQKKKRPEGFVRNPLAVFYPRSGGFKPPWEKKKMAKLSEKLIKEIEKMLEGLEDGQIRLIVKDSEIIRVDRIERTYFTSRRDYKK